MFRDVPSRPVTASFLLLAGLGLVAWSWMVDVHWFERHVLSDYCAVDSSDLWLERLVRGGAFALQARR
jgi:hypothetical protein